MRIICLLFIVFMLACKTDQKQESIIDAIQSDTLNTKLTEEEHLETIAIPSSADEEAPLTQKPRPGWIEIIEDEYTKLDLRYATANNFVAEQMYDCGRCFIREEAHSKLAEIRSTLKDQGVGIILYDCYRPRPVQQKLWDKVPNPSYVTPPKRGSMHNRGVALDIGLINAEGEIMDMGTEFDYFGREGHHDYYDHPQEVLANRKLLKSTMEQHSFASIRTEWWHYSYVIGEYEIAEWLWDCQ